MYYRYRGILGGLNSLTYNLGLLYGITIGGLVPLVYLSWVMVVPAAIFLVFSWFLVESPLWLMKVGREEEAERNLVWLRGPDYDVGPELKELRDLINNNANSTSTRKLSLLKKREFLIPLGIALSIFVIEVFNFNYVIFTFGLSMFEEYSSSGLSALTIATLLQVPL